MPDAIVRITTAEGERHGDGSGDPYRRRRLLTRRFLRRLSRVIPPDEHPLGGTDDAAQ